MSDSSKRKILLYPTTMLVATAILIVLFAAFGVFEFSRARRDLTSMMEEQGSILLDVLMAGSERSILAYEEIEKSVQDRLVQAAEWVLEQDREGRVTPDRLDEIAEVMEVYRIHLFDAAGNRIRSNTSPHADEMSASSARFDYVLPLITAEVDTLIVGFREGGIANEPRYVAGLRRRTGGAVIVAADARRLLDLRRELGPGRLVQDVGDRPGVEYVVLQDTMGILMASRSVTGISRIDSDPFLSDVWSGEGGDSRMTEFEDERLFEIAGVFYFGDEAIGLLRLGLSVDHFENILKNARLRLAFVGLIVLLAGIAGLAFMLANQNVRLLAESYRRVQTHTGEILQNMGDAVIAVDGDGRVTVFNEAAQQLYGVSSRKAVGRPISDLNLPSLPIMESLRSGRSEERVRRKVLVSGGSRVVSMKTSVMKSAAGRVETVILVATDLTSESRLEEQLRRREKLSAMGELASGVAHEVRNPINAIGMIAQRFLKEFRPREEEAEYRELAESIVRETRRTHDIIQRFLRFAKPAPLRPAFVSVKEFLNEVGGDFKSVARDKDVKLHVLVQEDAFVRIDRDRMKQAMLNLLRNALDATPPGGGIDVEGRVVAGGFEILVKDTGSGIPEAIRSKVFDLYFTTKDTGTGMGLPVVHQIVQGHGGEIQAESEEGRGTTFRIRLPMEEDG